MNKKLLSCLILSLGINYTAYSYEIRPIPQETIEGNSIVSITPQINLVIENGTNEKSSDRIKEVLEKFNLEYSENSSISNSQTNIIIGSYNGDFLSEYAKDNNIDLSFFETKENKFDDHIIQINRNSPNGDIVIIGNGNGSEFYAMATLEQILEQKEGDKVETLTIKDFAYTEYRGIVEGFYGHTYSVDTRLELLEFCKRYKMNTYIYGPKSDPYHLGWWKEDYPETVTEEQRYKGFITQDDLRTISSKAIACNVDFVWAAHPGMQNGITFTESGIESGVNDIMKKFDHLYSLGLRAFGVFIDDMSYTPSGEMQAMLATKAQEALRNRYGSEVAPLFFVPTSYALNYDIGGARLRALKDVDKDVVIAFTGYDCFSNIRGTASETMKEYCGRNAVMWWNNPVNDDHDNWIYMRKMTTHWTIEDNSPIPSLGGLVMNPMNQGNASKVILFSAAEYSWNPSEFNDDESWESFFTTEIKDENIREALRTFAIHSDARIEEQRFIDSYETFKNEYTPGKLPAVAESIKEEMTKLYDACITLEGMKNHEIKAYQLLYNDIHPWIAKLKSVSSIIKDAITVMSGNNPESWALRSNIQNRVQNLNTDKAFQVSALEEAGTNTIEKFYQAEASKEHMTPFAEYIATLINDFEETLLPERNNKPEIISNITALPESISLFEDSDFTGIKGLKNIILEAKEYIGLNMNSIKETNIKKIPEEITEGLEIQYSINGKEWTAYPLADIESKTELVYVRVKNISEKEAISIPFDMLAVNTTAEVETTTPAVSTNMNAYQTYFIENVIDGNKETFFWKDSPQSTGDEIILDFGVSAKRNAITVCFTDNDRPTGEMGISLSEDGEIWNEIAAFTKENIDSNGEYHTDAQNQTARYVRLQIKSVNEEYWLQIAEISVEGEKSISQATNENGEYINLLGDRKLDKGYKAEKEGYVIYRFIENIKIKDISIYNSIDFTNSSNAPEVELMTNQEWIKLGTLESYTTKFNVFDKDSISALRISWDSENIPDLVEIYPEGEPYIEKETSDPGTSVNESQSETDNIRVAKADNSIYIAGNKRISLIKIWNTDGQILREINADSKTYKVTGIDTAGIYIIQITLDNGRTFVRKA